MPVPGHLVPSVVNGPALNGNDDAAFGIFALSHLFEWLQLQSVITYKFAKELTGALDETGATYKSCVDYSSSVGKAFFDQAASEQSGSIEKAAAVRAIEIDQENEQEEVASDGSAGSNSGGEFVTEMATFEAALKKQTWLKQRTVFDLHALHQNLSFLRFAKDKNLLPNDAHDDILIELLDVPPPGGRTTDDVDQKRRLDAHRKKARGKANLLIADGEVLRDFPTIFLLNSRGVNIRSWRSCQLAQNCRVVLKHLIAELEACEIMTAWKDDFLTLLKARLDDGSLEELSENTLVSALDGIDALEIAADGVGTLVSKIGKAIRKDLRKADALVLLYDAAVLEDTAAERREGATALGYGAPVSYHAGEEGEIDKNPTQCFVVDNTERGLAGKGKLFVSKKMEGSIKWPALLENLESREDVVDEVDEVDEDDKRQQDSEEEEDDEDYQEESAKDSQLVKKRKTVKKTSRKKPKKKKRKVKNEDKDRAMICSGFNGFTTSVDPATNEITFVQVDKDVDVTETLSGFQLLTFQLSAMTEENKRLEKEYNSREKRRQTVIARTARLEADLQKLREEEDELTTEITELVVTQQLYSAKTAKLQNPLQAANGVSGEDPFNEWCIRVLAELFCCHWTLLPFSNHFELTPNGQYSL